MSNLYVGQAVSFGRPNGEKTLGVITKVNGKSVKVRQTEVRGGRPVGTLWTVAQSFCTPVGAAPQVMAPEVQARLKANQDRDFDFLRGGAAKPARSEAEIRRDIRNIYSGLSPENLTCDGELSRAQVSQRAAALNARLRACFKELGREMSEGEAYGMVG